MTDELITALTKVEGLQVASRTSVFALKNVREDVRSAGRPAQRVGRARGNGAEGGQPAPDHGPAHQRRRRADALVGALRPRDGGCIRHPGRDRRDHRAHPALDPAGRAGRSHAGALHRERASLQPVSQGPLLVEPAHPGRHRRRESATSSRRSRRIPGYALAYSGLADSYALDLDYRGAPVIEGMERAKAEARKAIELDETLAEAHTSLGWVTFIYDWDWAGAEREFRRAIELNPRYATARQWYSWFLVAMGRFEEALAEGRAAVELDPASVSIRRSLGWLQYYARQHRRRAGEPAACARHGSHRRGDPPAAGAGVCCSRGGTTKPPPRSGRRWRTRRTPCSPLPDWAMWRRCADGPEEAREVLRGAAGAGAHPIRLTGGAGGAPAWRWAKWTPRSSGWSEPTASGGAGWHICRIEPMLRSSCAPIPVLRPAGADAADIDAAVTTAARF